jgi:hypothetical protein
LKPLALVPNRTKFIASAGGSFFLLMDSGINRVGEFLEETFDYSFLMELLANSVGDRIEPETAQICTKVAFDVLFNLNLIRVEKIRNIATE